LCGGIVAALFFSFDGIDGAGKSTQQTKFVAWLKQQGRDVVECRDPGSTPLGERLRSLLLERSHLAISPASEMFLYMAARAQLVQEVIRPALEQGKTVVCDRFLLANIVYQGHAGGLDPAAVRATGQLATGGCLPQLTFLCDVPVPVAWQRLNRELDRMEARGQVYMEQVRQGFLEEVKHYPTRVEIVDSLQSPEAMFAQIVQIAEPLLRSE
jgi:dTMP kinase